VVPMMILGQTEACMSLALGFGTNVFDVQGLLTLSLQLQLHGGTHG
jgi:hypothetical protein